MTDKKMSLGQAIDQIINALEALEQNARQTAIDAACQHLGINSTNVGNTASPHPIQQEPIAKPTSTGIGKVDIRTFKEQKDPASASQMACVVAYYLQELAPENERKDTVTAKDLEKYFKQAKFKLPKTISQLLPDSRSAGYFESAPGKGEYALNAVGYNLVAHNLPKSSTK